MASKTKDRLVATYFYEDAPHKIVEVYGIYPVDSCLPDEYEWYDLIDEACDCINLGDPIYSDDGPPSWATVLKFIKNSSVIRRIDQGGGIETRQQA